MLLRGLWGGVLEYGLGVSRPRFKFWLIHLFVCVYETFNVICSPGPSVSRLGIGDHSTFSEGRVRIKQDNVHKALRVNPQQMAAIVSDL